MDNKTLTETIQALVVPFAAGFVVQRALEIVDPFISGWIKDPNMKKFAMGMGSLVIGVGVACVGEIRMFEALGHAIPGDCFFTGIFISAGTEGFNILLKFANYKKETSKAVAANAKDPLSAKQLSSVNAEYVK